MSYQHLPPHAFVRQIIKINDEGNKLSLRSDRVHIITRLTRYASELAGLLRNALNDKKRPAATQIKIIVHLRDELIRTLDALEIVNELENNNV